MRKHVEIRRLAYGRETNVTSLFDCGARRATRRRKTERTDSLVSTESDEATPRDERYGGGGPHGGVCENNFAHTAALTGGLPLDSSVTCSRNGIHRGVLVVL